MTYVPKSPFDTNWLGNYPAMTQQGWVCPCCRRVYSPSTPMCFSCGNQTVQPATTTSTGYVHTGPAPDIKWDQK